MREENNVCRPCPIRNEMNQGTSDVYGQDVRTSNDDLRDSTCVKGLQLCEGTSHVPRAFRCVDGF